MVGLLGAGVQVRGVTSSSCGLSLRPCVHGRTIPWDQSQSLQREPSFFSDSKRGGGRRRLTPQTAFREGGPIGAARILKVYFLNAVFK